MCAALSPTLDATLISGPVRDPAPFLAELREQDPVCWLPGLDTWLVTRRADVQLLFSAALTPRATARLEQWIRNLVEEFAAPLRGRTDVIAARASARVRETPALVDRSRRPTDMIGYLFDRATSPSSS
jgi:cytochrome P450